MKIYNEMIMMDVGRREGMVMRWVEEVGERMSLFSDIIDHISKSSEMRTGRDNMVVDIDMMITYAACFMLRINLSLEEEEKGEEDRKNNI